MLRVTFRRHRQAHTELEITDEAPEKFVKRLENVPEIYCWIVLLDTCINKKSSSFIPKKKNLWLSLSLHLTHPSKIFIQKDV